MDLVNFNWERDPEGYEVRDEHVNPETGDFEDGPANPGEFTWRNLRGRSGRLETIRPLDSSRALFVELARADHGERGAIAFVNEFGPLFRTSPVTMEVWPIAVMGMSAAVRMTRNPNKFRAIFNVNSDRGTIKFNIGLGPNLDIGLVPDSLFSAAWLQLALHVASGGQLHACDYCSKPFVSGPNTRRRKTAKYCGKPCRQRAWRRSQTA